MKKLFISMVLFSLLIVGFSSATVKCNDNSGSIWTTGPNCGPEQNGNHYAIGDSVWIRGEGFCNEVYAWDITGQPGKSSCDPTVAVAADSYTVGPDGTFCFEAYTVASDDCGEYKATFDGNKHDNYRVDDLSVPEFGVIAGAVALIGAAGIFLFRRKN